MTEGREEEKKQRGRPEKNPVEREANKHKQGHKRRGRGTREYKQRKQSRIKEQPEGNK